MSSRTPSLVLRHNLHRFHACAPLQDVRQVPGSPGSFRHGKSRHRHQLDVTLVTYTHRLRSISLACWIESESFGSNISGHYCICVSYALLTLYGHLVYSLTLAVLTQSQGVPVAAYRPYLHYRWTGWRGRHQAFYGHGNPAHCIYNIITYTQTNSTFITITGTPVPSTHPQYNIL